MWAAPPSRPLLVFAVWCYDCTSPKRKKKKPKRTHIDYFVVFKTTDFNVADVSVWMALWGTCVYVRGRHIVFNV